MWCWEDKKIYLKPLKVIASTGNAINRDAEEFASGSPTRKPSHSPSTHLRIPINPYRNRYLLDNHIRYGINYIDLKEYLLNEQ